MTSAAQGTRRNSPSAARVLTQSAATVVVFRAVNVASGLVTLPLLLASLSQVEFGVWIVMSQAVSLLALSDFGAGNAIGRFVARARGLEDEAAISEVLSTVLAILLGAGLLVAIATWILAPYMPGWVGVDAEYSRTATQVFLVIGAGLAVQLPLRLAYGVLVGYQLYGQHAVGKILDSVLTLAGILVLYALARLNLLTLAVLTAGAAVTAQAVLFVYAWKITRPWSISSQRVSLPTAARVLGMGGSVLVMTAAGMIYTQGTGLLAGRLIGVAGVAIYGVALTIVSNLHPLITSIANPLSTLSSEWQARNDMEQLRRTNAMVMKMTFATSACVAVGLVLFGDPALRIWLKSSNWSDADFREASRALAIMGVALAIGLPQIGARSTLQGVGEHWQVALSMLAAAAVSLAIGGLAMAAGWGVTGAALGWSVVWIIQGTVLFPPLIARYLDQPLGRMMVEAYAPGLALAAAVLLLAWTLDVVVAPSTAAQHVVVATVSAAAAGAGILRIGPRGWTARLRLRKG